MPEIGRQDAGGDQRLDQRRLRLLVGLDQIADAARSPRARERPASAPSSQRRSSRPSCPDRRTENAASAASSR